MLNDNSSNGVIPVTNQKYYALVEQGAKLRRAARACTTHLASLLVTTAFNSMTALHEALGLILADLQAGESLCLNEELDTEREMQDFLDDAREQAAHARLQAQQERLEEQQVLEAQMTFDQARERALKDALAREEAGRLASLQKNEVLDVARTTIPVIPGPEFPDTWDD